MSRLAKLLWNLCEWVLFLFCLQVMMFIGTVVGLVIAGFTPALTSGILLSSDRLNGQADGHWIKRYVTYYRQVFLVANLHGLVTVIVGLICYSNILFFKDQAHQYQPLTVLEYMWVIITVILWSAWLSSMPTAVKKKLNPKDTCKLILSSMGSLDSLLMLICSLIIILGLTLYVTGAMVTIFLGAIALAVAMSNRLFQERLQHIAGRAVSESK